MENYFSNLHFIQKAVGDKANNTPVSCSWAQEPSRLLCGLKPRQKQEAMFTRAPSTAMGGLGNRTVLI